MNPFISVPFPHPLGASLIENTSKIVIRGIYIMIKG